MMRTSLLARGSLRSSAILLCAVPPKITDTGAMHTHVRSEFKYEASTKSGSVGARNEAAYVGYKAFQPGDIQGKFAMPHIVNLLTVLPFWLVAFALTALGWGVVLWDIYARKFFDPIVIQRPKTL